MKKNDEILSKEIMIAKNGKPLFAVRIDSGGGNDANYVYVENGDIKFSSSWLNSIIPFSMSSESHRIAKEIFTEGMRTAIKVKILELKQLESIFEDINLGDCLGNILVDNTRLLLEVKNSVERAVKKAVSKDEVKAITAEIVEKGAIKPEDIKLATETAIADCINPIAIKKTKRPAKTKS